MGERLMSRLRETMRCLGQARRGLFCGGLLLVSLGTLGCDNLPWSSSSGKHSDTASAALTTAQSGVSPGRPAVPPDDVVAMVNKVPISKADLELRLKDLKVAVESAGQTWTPLPLDAPEGQLSLKGVMKELVNAELMSQDAVARGLDRTLPVQQRWESLRRTFFAQEWLRSNQDHIAVTDDEINKYYEENKAGAGFREPQRLKLRQLVIASEEQANHALAQLHGGTTEFDALAQQISLGPTAAQGGLLSSWVMRASDKAARYTEQEASSAGIISLDPALEAAAFAIDQVGGLSSYVKGADNHYHILKMVERKDERQRDKSELWDDIKGYLTVQKLQATIEELRTKATIERHPERLEGIAP